MWGGGGGGGGDPPLILSVAVILRLGTVVYMA